MISWLASYPKSGNTWVRALLSAYLEGKVDINHMAIRFFDSDLNSIRRASPKPLSELTIAEFMCLRYGIIAQASIMGGVMKTHGCYSKVAGIAWIPEALTERAIYIVRDPRDVALSYANHFAKDLDQAIEEMGSLAHIEEPGCRGIVNPMADWSTHITSWLKERPFPRMMVRYEDLQADTATCLGKMTQFLGWGRDEERISKAVSAASFRKLSFQEQENGFYERSNVCKRFFRQGKSGAWKKVLSKAQRKEIERRHKPVMKQLGYL